MWCIVADNNDEFWVYGLFGDKKDAEDHADKLELLNPEIEYTVAEFIAAGR